MPIGSRSYAAEDLRLRMHVTVRVISGFTGPSVTLTQDLALLGWQASCGPIILTGVVDSVC